MKYKNFNMKEHGFVGHMAEPDAGSDRAVIIVMGGEQSLLPGIKFAERFADYGITGLSVSLFGAEGLPNSPNQIPVDMFLPAIRFLREQKGIQHISIYGQSMGSIFAVLAAQYIGGFENLIMVSPTHIPFEGTLKDKKTMTGRSVATWKGKDIPYVTADFSKVKAGKYQRHPDAKCKVTGMWVAYHDAYMDAEKVNAAELHVEKTAARVLLIAGDEDEAWPAEYSVRTIEKDLKHKGYDKDVKVIVYPHGSHLNGLMPNKKREKKLYRMIPLIGLMYKTFGKYQKENLSYFEKSEKEIIEWVNAKI
ncbi:MAG: alpha/beta hydrolase [Lachnospiraceae bacterium]|nr:alpha/beta hydrolase [Lachnospiraceae bacterium]MBR4608633.1 alpha/beta hydrolase [Lachnospiraceae bacterium]